jgi:opacity protein-like surface antigen
MAFVSNFPSVSAQTKGNYEIGINVGTLIYQGDLNNTAIGATKNLKPAIGVYVNKELDTYFSLRASLLYGKIGDDESQYINPSWKQQRNFKFSTSVTELSTVLVWNFLGDNGVRDYRTFSPYVFGGVGISLLNVKRDWSSINRTAFDDKSSAIIGLGIDTLRATPKILPVIPVGIGLRYAVNNKISIRAEATYRLNFSDYIDGFSQAGNPTANDKYYGLSIGMGVKLFSNNYKCPTVR